MRVHVPANGLYTYPDVSVVCSEGQHLEETYLDTLRNPLVLPEVVSARTGKYDRADQFLIYKRIASLQHYVVVESHRPLVGVYTRDTNSSWLFQEYKGADAVPLPALRLELPLTGIHRKITFSA